MTPAQAPTDLAYSRSRLPLLIERMRRSRKWPALHAATARTHREIVRHVAKRWRLP